VSKFKKLLIPAIVLVVLVAGLLVVTKLPEPEVDNSQTPAGSFIQIFDFVKDDVTEIEIDNKQDILIFKYVTAQVEEVVDNEDGTQTTSVVDKKIWQAVQPADMKVNSSAVDSIAYSANTLKANKLIEENPADLAIYGLNNPVKISFRMKDGTNHILHIGNETVAGGAFYAKKENEPKVYTVGNYEVQKFLQTKFQLMMTELYAKAYTPQDVTAITYTRKGEKLFDSTLGDQKWWITHPVQTEARYENLYAIAGSLASISINEYVEENAVDLGKYGLANPSYIFDYTLDGQQYKLSLGSMNPAADAYYATLNDNNLVVTIDKNSFTFLDKPIEELVTSFIHLQNIKEVSKLVVSFDGRTDITNMQVNQEDDELSIYNYNGIELTGAKDADYVSAFKKYYQGAIGFYVNKLELEATPVLQNPEVTVVFTLTTGEEIKIELVSDEEGVYFYAFKNGKYTGIKARKRQLDDESYKGLRVTRKQLDEKLAERTAQ